MPETRQFTPAEIRVTQGGRFAPDMAHDSIGPADYAVKQGWRREGDVEVEREGWLHFFPNTGGNATNQRTAFSGGGASVDQLFEVRRANGQVAIVGICAAQGVIKWFDFANSTWTQIGSGFQTSGIRRWQAIGCGGYAVFNNGVDLPVTWVIGDASVTPIHEMREQGIASVGDIAVVNDILLCSDVTEIIPAELAGIMGGGSPYGVVASNKTQRIAYRTIWSNNGSPRDFAAVVNGSINSGSPTLTLAWPMASFTVGTELTILGAGSSGGNLVRKISAVSGVTVTLDGNALTTVTNAKVQKTTALNSIVGYKDLGDDGSAVLRQLKLGNRVVAYKASGQIFVGYYTGDIDEPWVYETAYAAEGRESRGLVFPYTLVEVNGYHLYAGASKFFMFSLGSQRPEIHPLLDLCSNTLFFSRVSTADINRIYASKNGCTEEVFFALPYTESAVQKYAALAYHHTEGEESVDEVTDFAFASAITVAKPTGDKASDGGTLWYLLGGYDGVVSVYGLSSLGVITWLRHGQTFTRSLEFGWSSLGDSFNEKDLRSWIPLMGGFAWSGQISVLLYGANRITQTPTLLTTKTLQSTSGDRPGLASLFFRRIYFKDRIQSVSGAGARFAGRIMEFGRVRSRSLTRISG